MENNEEHKEHHSKHHRVEKHEVQAKPEGHGLEVTMAGIAILLTVVIAFNLFQIYTIHTAVGQTAAPIPPAKLELTVLTDSSCPNCFNIQQVVSMIASANVILEKNTTLDAATDIAQIRVLASKYGIDRLPAVIVTGETSKASLSSLTAVGDALVFSKASAPFVNLSNLKKVGLVEAIYLEPASCPACQEEISLLKQLNSSGVIVAKVTNLKSDTTDAQRLIALYNITKLPTVILSKDASAYSVVNSAWPNLGSIESDGSLVLRDVAPVYYDVSQGKARGYVTLTYLADASCPSCYNVSLHRDVLVKGYGVAIQNETMLDISSPAAKALIKKYKIESVPTMLISPEIAVYSQLTPIWATVGSVESDGTYVFRMINAIGGTPVFRNLTSGKLVNTNSTA